MDRHTSFGNSKPSPIPDSDSFRSPTFQDPELFDCFLQYPLLPQGKLPFHMKSIFDYQQQDAALLATVVNDSQLYQTCLLGGDNIITFTPLPNSDWKIRKIFLTPLLIGTTKHLLIPKVHNDYDTQSNGTFTTLTSPTPSPKLSLHVLYASNTKPDTVNMVIWPHVLLHSLLCLKFTSIPLVIGRYVLKAKQ